jgi:hypothetical protein
MRALQKLQEFRPNAQRPLCGDTFTKIIIILVYIICYSIGTCQTKVDVVSAIVAETYEYVIALMTRTEYSRWRVVRIQQTSLAFPEGLPAINRSMYPDRVLIVWTSSWLDFPITRSHLQKRRNPKPVIRNPFRVGGCKSCVQGSKV